MGKDKDTCAIWLGHDHELVILEYDVQSLLSPAPAPVPEQSDWLKNYYVIKRIKQPLKHRPSRWPVPK